jgi:hypothetical protein
MQKNYNGIRLVDIGVYLTIIVYISAQFIEITFFNLGNVQVSFQKALAIFLYPISILFMRRFFLNRHLYVFSINLAFAYTLALCVFHNEITTILSSLFLIIVGTVGAGVLYTALIVGGISGFRFFSNTWIAFTLITSVLSVLQALGLIPLFNVPEEHLQMRLTTEGYFRGVGLKFDPNFQSFMLALGLSLIVGKVANPLLKLCFSLITFAGILATYSRMGIFLAIIVVIAKYTVKIKNILMILPFLLIFLGAVIFARGWVPLDVQDYFTQRFSDISKSISILLTGNLPNGVLSSGMARAVLLRSSVELIKEHWFVGVGAYQTNEILFEYSGIKNVAHNTYLEFILIGGLSGFFALLFYGYIILRGFRKRIPIIFSVNKETMILFTIVFLGGAMFLSITYNSILWLPLIFALVLPKWKAAVEII